MINLEIYENQITTVYTRTKEEDEVVVGLGESRWIVKDMRIDIKVGNEKTKVMLSDILKALKDAIETGDFEMDEIDSAVWKIESKLEETQEKLDSAMDLIESRGRI